MTKESITPHSDEIKKSISDFYLDYPMGSYIPSWKVFRAFTNENKIIADQILSTQSWKDVKPKRLLDIGVGDGLVLKSIISQAPNKISYLKLVEPNATLCEEAVKNLQALKLDFEVEALKTDILSLVSTAFTKVDLAIMAHVLYLMPEADFIKLLEHLPPGVPLVIITDAVDSLFPNCWQLAAPKYYERSQHVHKVIEGLDQKRFSVRRSQFKTFLQNPYLIEREDLQMRILSMMCYSDYGELELGTQKLVKDRVERFRVDDLVFCNSVCYEVLPLTFLSSGK